MKFYSSKIKLKLMKWKKFFKMRLDANLIVIIILLVIVAILIIRELSNCKNLLECILAVL
jgi:hypothetical protein